MRIKQAILLVTSVLALGIVTSGCSSSNSTSTKSSSTSAKSSSVKKEEAEIVGSYRDDADGAAITLNADGTGTYVMADPTKADIHDQVTWKKEKNNYVINLNDSNYDTPIDARLNDENLSLVGNDKWPNQNFKKVDGEFNLDEFIREQHAKKDKSSETSKSTQSSTEARATLKKWAKDNHKDTTKVDSLKAKTDLSEPDEGWAFVDDNGTEYAIVRNGKVYPRPVLDNANSN